MLYRCEGRAIVTRGKRPNALAQPSTDDSLLTYAFNAGRAAANKSFLNRYARIHRRVIFRELRRSAMKRVDEMDREDEARQKARLPPPKKPSATQIVSDAVKRHLEVSYRWQTRKTRREEFQRVAREAGLSVKRLKRIRSLLAGLALQELLAAGVVTLPGLGRLQLLESEPRRRAVNIAGRVGRTGVRGVVETVTSARSRFRPSASLKRALSVATEAGLIVLENLERRVRRRSFPDTVGNWPSLR